MKEVNDTLKKLLEQNAMIAEHVHTDKPVDAVAGEWALRVVIFVGGAGGMWVLSKLPRIWELLGG